MFCGVFLFPLLFTVQHCRSFDSDWMRICCFTSAMWEESENYDGTELLERGWKEHKTKRRLFWVSSVITFCIQYVLIIVYDLCKIPTLYCKTSQESCCRAAERCTFANGLRLLQPGKCKKVKLRIFIYLFTYLLAHTQSILVVFLHLGKNPFSSTNMFWCKTNAFSPPASIVVPLCNGSWCRGFSQLFMLSN